jgi:hypothetical protein
LWPIIFFWPNRSSFSHCAIPPKKKNKNRGYIIHLLQVRFFPPSLKTRRRRYGVRAFPAFPILVFFFSVLLN